MPWIILFSLCIAMFSVNSKAQEQPAEQLLNIEVATYQLSSAFSAYVLFVGSPKYDKELNSTIEKAGPILANAKTNLPDIAKKWQESLDFIERSKELVFSPDDHRLIIGFATFQNPLYQLIEQKKQSISQNSSSSLVVAPALEEYLITRVSFERVVAQYIALSASSAGFVVSDISIEENVNTFSMQLANVENKGEDHQRLLMKWNFIKSNMLKNPGQTSPFITMRTAIDIRKLLQQVYQDPLLTDSNF